MLVEERRRSDRNKGRQAQSPGDVAPCRLWVQATFPLQDGSDQEINLQALIGAAEMLKERFEQELAELRQESD